MRMPGRRAIAWLAVALALAVGSVEAAEIVVGREATVRSVDGVNLRASPSTDAEILTIAEGGDFVQVLATEGDWAKVEYDGAVGWAHTRYLGPARDRGEVSTRGRRPGAVVTESGVRLPIPYRTQLDGSAYQGANCGPASIAMAIQAFGKYVPTTDIRRAANRIQGTTGWYDTGTALETLTEIVSDQGLVPRGLFARDGGGKARGYDRWSMDDVRQALRNGHLVIPQVHLATLPGQEHSNRGIDHFIVIIGYYDDVFIYHDPAFNGNGGHSLQISEDRLSLAWRRGDFPFAGFSVGPGEGMEPLLEPVAPPVQVAVATPVSPPPIVTDRELAREQLRRYFEAEPPTTLAIATPPVETAVAPPAPTAEPVADAVVAPTASAAEPRVIGPDPAWPALLAAVLGLALLGSRRVLSVREATIR
jgi:uncharacterized protein YvpB